MKIDYNGTLTSKTVDFQGEIDNGKTFAIVANWNDWDGWTVDDILWYDDKGLEEEIEMIKKEFESTMN